MSPRSSSSRDRSATQAQDEDRPIAGHSIRVTFPSRGLMALLSGVILVGFSLVQGPEWQEPESLAGVILPGHTGQVNAVAFAPDGRILASGGEDRIAMLWDLTADGGEPRSLVHAAPVFAVAFAPDGRTLATGGLDASVRLWDATTGQILCQRAVF